jgi:hypothetical protein
MRVQFPSPFGRLGLQQVGDHRVGQVIGRLPGQAQGPQGVTDGQGLPSNPFPGTQLVGSFRERLTHKCAQLLFQFGLAGQVQSVGGGQRQQRQGLVMAGEALPVFGILAGSPGQHPQSIFDGLRHTALRRCSIVGCSEGRGLVGVQGRS